MAELDQSKVLTSNAVSRLCHGFESFCGSDRDDRFGIYELPNTELTLFDSLPVNLYTLS